ncbi:Sensor histidine kinase RcsC [subsurface metagenome]
MAREAGLTLPCPWLKPINGDQETELLSWRTGQLKEKILIVEDNPQNMRLIEMTLGAGDYALVKATDGEEALDLVTSERPDLIVMDIQLPRISGLEVTRRLRQMPEFRHVPIVALTAYTMKGDEEKCIEAGCDAYLAKPINTRELPEIIAGLLVKRKQDGS